MIAVFSSSLLEDKTTVRVALLLLPEGPKRYSYLLALREQNTAGTLQKSFILVFDILDPLLQSCNRKKTNATTCCSLFILLQIDQVYTKFAV